MAGARGVAVAAVALALATGTAPAGAASWRLQDEGVQCAERPASPDTFAVTAIGANRVAVPDSAPPIAILDSGIAQAPEFAGRIRTGINVTSGSTPTPDNNGHGTAVASVAAAAAGGVRGVSPSSPLIPIKIMNVGGQTTADWVVAGITEAVKRGARVINLSAAAPSGSPLTAQDRQVMNAIDEAFAKGVLVVAPSGNEGAGRIDIPASYPHVLAVGATDASNARASFSNTGAGLDLVAPGDAVVTVSPHFICSSGYSLASGTSFAAPAAAGAAALLLASNPKLDASQVMDIVRLRAERSAAAAWSAELGFGLLDLPSMLAAPLPAAQPREVDDDVYWVQRRAFTLTPARSKASARGVVTARQDPADVYRLKLRAGDRLTAGVSTAGARVALWSSKTGSYDITLNRKKGLVKQGGRTISGARISKAGIYYVAVTPAANTFAGVDYTLTLKRSR